jgi:hypothetical protein
MNARSFRERDGWRSFLSTLASICRMRSRVMAKDWAYFLKRLLRTVFRPKAQ